MLQHTQSSPHYTKRTTHGSQKKPLVVLQGWDSIKQQIPVGKKVNKNNTVSMASFNIRMFYNEHFRPSYPPSNALEPGF